MTARWWVHRRRGNQLLAARTWTLKLARSSEFSEWQDALCIGLMVLRFDVSPMISCQTGCSFNTSQVAAIVENLVNSFSFNLTDIRFNTLYVDQLPAFYSWSGQLALICLTSAYRMLASCNIILRTLINHRQGLTLSFLAKYTVSLIITWYNEIMFIAVWIFEWSEHVSRVALCSEILYIKFKLSQAIRSWNVTIFSR